MNIELTIYEIVNFIVSEPLRASLDFLSHFITGIILANILLRNKPFSHKIFIGIIGGFLPDFDFFLQMQGIMQHGTFTHTLFFLIPLTIGGALFFRKPLRNKSFYTYSKFVSLCVILHIVADLGGNYIEQIVYISSIVLAYYIIDRIAIRKSHREADTIKSD